MTHFMQNVCPITSGARDCAFIHGVFHFNKVVSVHIGYATGGDTFFDFIVFNYRTGYFREYFRKPLKCVNDVESEFTLALEYFSHELCNASQIFTRDRSGLIVHSISYSFR